MPKVGKETVIGVAMLGVGLWVAYMGYKRIF